MPASFGVLAKTREGRAGEPRQALNTVCLQSRIRPLGSDDRIDSVTTTPLRRPTITQPAEPNTLRSGDALSPWREDNHRRATCSVPCQEGTKRGEPHFALSWHKQTSRSPGGDPP